MGTIRVDAVRAIAAPPTTVYSYISDMREHERFLPPAFSDYAVISGGQGAGTVTSFNVTAGGRTRSYQMTVAEPQPGVLTETDANSSLVTTFAVSAKGEGSLVSISTTWTGAKGIGGFFERLFAPKAMKTIYLDELERLDSFIAERLADDAKVQEADEESFPTSDPPAF